MAISVHLQPGKAARWDSQLCQQLEDQDTQSHSRQGSGLDWYWSPPSFLFLTSEWYWTFSPWTSINFESVKIAKCTASKPKNADSHLYLEVYGLLTSQAPRWDEDHLCIRIFQVRSSCNFLGLVNICYNIPFITRVAGADMLEATSFRIMLLHPERALLISWSHTFLNGTIPSPGYIFTGIFYTM